MCKYGNYSCICENFPPFFSQCTSKSSSTTHGTCLTQSECAAKSGQVDGNCAAGFGVCCIFTYDQSKNWKTLNFLTLTFISIGYATSMIRLW